MERCLVDRSAWPANSCTVAVPTAFAIHVTFVAKVTASDPMFFLPTISALLAVGIFAAAVPAFRASRIDPIAALRQE